MSNVAASGFDLLGAEHTPQHRLSWSGGVLALASGAAAAVLYRKHPMLAFLNTAALVSNAHAVAKGDRTWKDAIKRMGRHVVATAGSLALPAYPATGYVAGAIAAELLIDGEGGGILEEWAHYAGVDEPRIVEAVEVKPDDKTKALVKV